MTDPPPSDGPTDGVQFTEPPARDLADDLGLADGLHRLVDPVDGAGVTRTGITARVATRRAAQHRRRIGTGAAAAAIALVVGVAVAGVGSDGDAGLRTAEQGTDASITAPSSVPPSAGDLVCEVDDRVVDPGDQDVLDVADFERIASLFSPTEVEAVVGPATGFAGRPLSEVPDPVADLARSLRALDPEERQLVDAGGADAFERLRPGVLGPYRFWAGGPVSMPGTVTRYSCTLAVDPETGAITTDTTAPIATVDPSSVRAGDVIATLAIERIGLEVPVREGTTAAELAVGVGHYAGTAWPGTLGNVAIAGHRATYGQEFQRLDELDPGDEILLTTAQATSTYRVTGTEIVEPDDISVLGDRGDARLTLTAPHPIYSLAERLVVTAELVDAPDPAATTPTTAPFGSLGGG